MQVHFELDLKQAHAQLAQQQAAAAAAQEQLEVTQQQLAMVQTRRDELAERLAAAQSDVDASTVQQSQVTADKQQLQEQRYTMIVLVLAVR